jgi:hypothetical protein
MKWGGLLRVLGLNAVPIGGVMLAGWSTGTGLALYWCETLLGTATNALRIALHRRFTGKRGHYRGQLGVEINPGKAGESEPRAREARRPRRAKTQWRSFLTEYLVGSLVFTFAHGLFLVLILGAVVKSWPTRDDMLYGLAGIALFQVGGVAFDLLSLRQWPFARLKREVQSAMGRVVLVHLAIIFGMALVVWLEKPGSFFWVFGGLKTLSDIGGLFAARSGVQATSSGAPPKWAKSVVAKLAPGEDFDVYWQRESEREQREAAADEEVMPAGRR